ncbi:acyl-CoA dehydrogenase family protein [Parvibaculum sp.]|uniref:acyl-CoA dehydrogenase family protein n=1 Tax=Parvibaculum sp. TaxID=2024848 RepID=UPI001B2A7B40|nr:acyl-CoA dehydrogenase family protein [Parvibaculum sp.]MBO6635450.1 acyl-CoA/acyl-ACP dehydrogenase [Parvibaculum sp.]MBO6678696.1 acyl-CoA/acyl-ACP dehydrogenase [Parvibaculum sp.]MBO6683944.1 acyl-CoA/acyl-ACP dehydrogenase [Parvibaculum sp.]MBO6906592.1 acyl-CoA/acyl-ACP dehydrogenase [Parvibaculum sp.]
MNLDFSDDQKMLKEQVRKFLADKCPMSVTRRVLDGDEPHAKEVWKGLVDMGLTGTAIPEEFGGLGLGALELCVIAEELGRAAAPVPFSSSIYLAAEAIKLFGTQKQKETWLPKLASGELIGTVAISEGTHAAHPRNIETSFSGGKVNGVKQPVADGGSAGVVVVAVNTGGSGEQAISLAIVDTKAGGVSSEALRTLDPSRENVTMTFKDAPAEILGDKQGQGWSQLSRVLDGAAVLFAFEQVGGTEAALEMARDYALERYAFGRQIGSYQAIKHKLADMYVKKELAKSNAYFGAMMLNDEGAELPEAAAASRIAGSDAYVFAAQENIQTHGGIGYTWESDCQFHYRRAKLLALTIGAPIQWKEKLVSRLEAKNAA